MSDGTSLRLLTATYPRIPWRDPIRVRVTDSPDDWFCCRICIANHGLKAEQLGTQKTRVYHALTPGPVEIHIRQEHL